MTLLKIHKCHPQFLVVHSTHGNRDSLSDIYGENVISSNVYSNILLNRPQLAVGNLTCTFQIMDGMDGESPKERRHKGVSTQPALEQERMICSLL
jgi:hypothetical protein